MHCGLHLLQIWSFYKLYKFYKLPYIKVENSMWFISLSLSIYIIGSYILIFELSVIWDSRVDGHTWRNLHMTHTILIWMINFQDLYTTYSPQTMWRRIGIYDTRKRLSFGNFQLAYLHNSYIKIEVNVCSEFVTLFFLYCPHYLN